MKVVIGVRSIVTVIVPAIATATDPNIVTVAMEEDMGRCTQQATGALTEVVVMAEEVDMEGTMEEDIKMEEVKG